jgi:hypothetical protein
LVGFPWFLKCFLNTVYISDKKLGEYHDDIRI